MIRGKDSPYNGHSRGRRATLAEVSVPKTFPTISSLTPPAHRNNRRTSISIGNSSPQLPRPSLIPRSPLASGRTSRKNSVASLGEHFTSLLSLSHALQFAQTLGEAVGPRRSDLSANDLADFVLDTITRRIKDKEKQDLSLPPQSAGGIDLSEGTLTGLDNMTRWGDASLDERPDKVYLAFTILLKDMVASYTWQSKTFRGETCTQVARVFLQIKIRHDKGDEQPDVVDFSVGSLEGLKVGVVGLGPLNWVGQKVIRGVVEENISHILLDQGRQVISSEVQHIPLRDKIYLNIIQHKIL